MTLRCTIDIETSNLEHLIGLLSPTMPTPVVSAYKTMHEALEAVCFELATGRLERKTIPAIKRVREMTGAGLREAKDAVETLDASYLFGRVGIP